MIDSPVKKFHCKAQAGGQKKKGSWENEFLPACSAARSAAVGWEATRPCVSKEARPAKIETFFSGRAQKSFSIKESILRALMIAVRGGEPLGEMPRRRRDISQDFVGNRFGFHSGGTAISFGTNSKLPDDDIRSPGPAALGGSRN